ncbi:MAG: 30S ribosomal protein S16 [Bacteroidetes bacterium]|nr:30S ribosomal protein S16 [Bacteroidota bacterium]MCB0846526.1 30S ribosomal protein S16 [Bacteroidota bacterium]MCB0855941.1 30S ribosomal protein S16 [Bacteroidota bacterium]
MPVKLRLKRQGRKQAVHYAIVASDSRSPRDGRYIEKIGTYDPVTQPAKIYVDHEAALKWLKVGAQPTNTVKSILRHAGVTVKFALFKQGKSEEEADKIFSKWWEAKKAKKKKKMVSCDIHGNPLEEVPVSEKPKPVAPAPEPEAPAEEEAPVVEETAVEEAPVAEETAVEETPADDASAEEEKTEE